MRHPGRRGRHRAGAAVAPSGAGRTGAGDRARFPVLWHEYGELNRAASELCGAGDPGIEQSAEQVTVKIDELKLGDVAERLGAVSV
jgi:hypothetical protein